MLFPTLLVISFLSSSAPPLNADEQAIIAATVTFAQLDPLDSTSLLHQGDLALSRLSGARSAAEPNRLTFTTYDGARQVLISDELISALRVANRKSVSLRKVPTIPRT